jgi:hypothetical protein
LIRPSRRTRSNGLHRSNAVTTPATTPSPIRIRLKAPCTLPRTCRRRANNTPIPASPIYTAHTPIPSPLLHILRHVELNLPNASEHAPQRIPEIIADFLLKQADGKWVERLQVLGEGVLGKVGVAFEHVDDDGAPGDDVTLLGFVVKEDEGADYVGAEAVSHCQQGCCMFDWGVGLTV